MITPVTPHDATQICEIYNHYIDTSVISFESSPVSEREMRERIAQVAKLNLPWLVAKSAEEVVGYAYATQWKARHAYRYCVEITIYLAPDTKAKGIGSALYEALFAALQQLDVHAVMACIALPNAHSIALHEKFGMRKVAHFEKVGFKFDRWLDVGYWQVNLKQ